MNDSVKYILIQGRNRGYCRTQETEVRRQRKSHEDEQSGTSRLTSLLLLLSPRTTDTLALTMSL